MIVIQSVSEWEMERVTDWDEMKGRRERERERERERTCNGTPIGGVVIALPLL